MSHRVTQLAGGSVRAWIQILQISKPIYIYIYLKPCYSDKLGVTRIGNGQLAG
jgi:hypothetical protein